VAETAAAQVWWARRGDAAADLATLLDDTEQQRWQAYRREEDRQRFLVGCSLAKAAVASYEGGRPADVALDRTCAQCGKPHGKPSVKGNSELELSVSHSGDRIAVAVTVGTPVGVDVEEAGKRGRSPGGEDLDALTRYVMSDIELASLTDSSPETFLVAWTRKEAVTKATGDGLRVPFREVIVSAPAQPPKLIAWPYPEPPESVSLFDLDAGPGYAAALAVIGRCDTVVPRDGTALLKTALA
jgi:4'-phosphopantetheinyl transferase